MVESEAKNGPADCANSQQGLTHNTQRRRIVGWSDNTPPSNATVRPDRVVRHPCERMLLREHTTDRKED